jgi:hypothetical protein
LDNRLPLKNHFIYPGIIALVLGIYSYPALKITAAAGSRIVPPISAPDLSLYLNISNIHTTDAGNVLDPYYGVPVPIARMGYLKFGTAFRLFRGLESLLHGSLWWSLLLWNLFWWGLLCLVAVWFFRSFLPNNSALVIVAGLAFLMLFNFGVLRNQLEAWIHPFSLGSFRDVELPYIRPFFPQIPTPLVILYLGLQIRALQKKSLSFWVSMVFIQFLAFAIFPYAMLMMAGISAVAILGQFLSKSAPMHWAKLFLYAAVCGAVDLAFFLHGNEATRSGGPTPQPLIHFQLATLPHRTGGTWLLLALFAVIVYFIRGLAPEIKWPVLGLAFSNLFLLLGDAFFSETALQVSQHAGYFVQVTATVLLFFIVSAALSRAFERKAIVRSAFSAAIVLLLLNGALMAEAGYRNSLPDNLEHAELARILHSDQPQEQDLVIARALSVDDDCAWVPLASNSHVLFCRNAQVLLSPEQNQQVQRFRQALYLYFTNKDKEWVEHILDDRKAITELTRLTFLGQVTTDAKDREQAIQEVRAELIPALIKVEDRDEDVRSFFARYRRVLVIDNPERPVFDRSRLSSYLEITKEENSGGLLVRDCVPLRP